LLDQSKKQFISGQTTDFVMVDRGEDMAYVDQNLITCESVAHRAKLHWVIFLKPGVVSLFLLAMAALLFDLVYKQVAPGQAAIFEWIGGALVLISAIPILATMTTRASAEFAVTNKRVILKTGIIQKKTAEMFLNKIESIGVDQSVVGRMLGYGTIVIRGTGGSLEPFDRVSAPLEFRRQIQEQIGRSFGPSATATPNVGT
jgi:uncharacterized membrane protein YdbT with pleckstrin-like domain